MAEEEKLSFLTLPAEIREQIYGMILNPAANRIDEPDEYSDYDYRDAMVLFKLNRQIYYEARKVFRDLNVFVRVETPWPDAQEHVAFEGHCAILMKEARAGRFQGYSLSVAVEAPQMDIYGVEPQYFVILLEDLAKFTKAWFYSDLSNPGLNHFLSVRMHLRDPYSPDWEEKRMPKWLQRDLLLPFVWVKNLRRLTITGDPPPLPSVEAELRDGMAIQPPGPEHCLSEAVRLKAEGNTQLNAGNYRGALELYNGAWEAMHVVVKGRQRHIHAEAFFARELREDPWKGKDGRVERLTMRVQLVANTCLAYLKMQRWEDVCFWGMRSILMMRQASLGPVEADWEVAPQDEAVLGFPAAVQMGKIYYRTALAFKELGDKIQARKLLRVAHVYLPQDEHVIKALGELSPRLG